MPERYLGFFTGAASPRIRTVPKQAQKRPKKIKMNGFIHVN
jgi:hypothetical protein